MNPWLQAILSLVLIVGPIVIIERVCSWLGVWDVPDDINPSAR